MKVPRPLERRRLLAAACAVLWLRPAQATPEALADALREYTGGAPLREGRVRLDIAPLVDNEPVPPPLPNCKVAPGLMVVPKL